MAVRFVLTALMGNVVFFFVTGLHDGVRPIFVSSFCVVFLPFIRPECVHFLHLGRSSLFASQFLMGMVNLS